ncbi:MAG: hypothetical protein AB7P04_14960 [Bacteriovoracia bacterium]
MRILTTVAVASLALASTALAGNRLTFANKQMRFEKPGGTGYMVDVYRDSRTGQLYAYDSRATGGGPSRGVYYPIGADQNNSQFLVTAHAPGTSNPAPFNGVTNIGSEDVVTRFSQPRTPVQPYRPNGAPAQTAAPGGQAGQPAGAPAGTQAGAPAAQVSPTAYQFTGPPADAATTPCHPPMQCPPTVNPTSANAAATANPNGRRLDSSVSSNPDLARQFNELDSSTQARIRDISDPAVQAEAIRNKYGDKNVGDQSWARSGPTGEAAQAQTQTAADQAKANEAAAADTARQSTWADRQAAINGARESNGVVLDSNYGRPGTTERRGWDERLAAYNDRARVQNEMGNIDQKVQGLDQRIQSVNDRMTQNGQGTQADAAELTRLEQEKEAYLTRRQELQKQAERDSGTIGAENEARTADMARLKGEGSVSAADQATLDAEYDKELRKNGLETIGGTQVTKKDVLREGVREGGLDYFKSRLKRAGGTEEGCEYSSALKGRGGCSDTSTAVQVSQVSDMAGQMVGQGYVGLQGQSAQMQAQTDGGISSPMRGMAKTANAAAMAQGMQGALNAGMTVWQMNRAKHHEEQIAAFTEAQENAETLLDKNGGAGKRGAGEEYTAGRVQVTDRESQGGKVAHEIVEKYKLNEDRYILRQDVQEMNECLAEKGGANPQTMALCQAVIRQQTAKRDKQFNVKHQGMAGDVADYSGMAVDEHRRAKSEADQGSFMSGIKGVANMIQGMFSKMAADEMNKAADKLDAAVANQTPPPVFQFDPSAGAQGDTPGGSVPLPSQTSAAAAALPEEGGGDGSGLPADLPTDKVKDDLAQGPKAGEFQRGGPNAGGSVGGSPGLSVGGAGGGAASAGGEGDGAPNLLGNSGGLAYDYGGSAGNRRGGGGGGGFDLAGAFKSMFGGGADGEKAQGKNILQYGSRGPASAGSDSLLSSNVNIFNRVSQTYQRKQSQGVFDRK